MDQEYTNRMSKIDAELERWLPQNPDDAWIEQVFTHVGKAASMDAIQTLIKPCRELLFRGGKRWRPLLMTLICEALSGGDASIPLSPVVEFSHNASLIHDDIEDESDERRGKPSIHKMFGVDTAINSGAFFYFLASSCIETFSQPNGVNNKEKIYKYWLDCMRRLHLGQAKDIYWHRNISFIPAIESYYTMCRLKTGSLARLAVELGSLTAGASPETVGVLSEAADMMGVGFQILDDVKNLTTGIPGKKKGDDVVEGKKGLPVLLYMHKYPERRERVFYCFHVAKREGALAPEVNELIETITPTGVLEEAEEKGRSMLMRTREIFASRDLPIDDKAHDLLEGFVNFIS